MKKTFFIAFLGALVFSSCCNKPCEKTHPCWSYDATIYELNTRQVTPEGTFAAAEEQILPQLKENGIDIIWVMPCQPIGEITRKGTLGSYYSIKDYCDINPEFGTKEDFRHFVNTAHEMGFKVILDWVANHTAPDHAWANNEGWHYRDSLGQLMVQYDWTDIAKLDYNNQAMRQAMYQSMEWWLDSMDIDGFRCDVAGEVPTDFWDWVMPKLQQNRRPLFTLAENEDKAPELCVKLHKKRRPLFTLAENEDKAPELCVKAFDMYYGWTLHHIMNEVAQGKQTVNDLWKYFAQADTLQPQAIRMNFTSNHDENSWNGTEYERMGDAYPLFAAFTYIVPGMPLIYTGQISGNNHRLEFFEKDVIDTPAEGQAPEFALYAKLNAFRKANKALWSNPTGAPMYRLDVDNDAIFACVRPFVCQECNKENTVIAIMNMSGEAQTVNLNLGEYAGEYTCICGKAKTLAEVETVTLAPWQYMLLSK